MSKRTTKRAGPGNGKKQAPAKKGAKPNPAPAKSKAALEQSEPAAEDSEPAPSEDSELAPSEDSEPAASEAPEPAASEAPEPVEESAPQGEAELDRAHDADADADEGGAAHAEGGESVVPAVDPSTLDGDEARVYLKGLIEALLFVAETPIGVKELARAAKIDRKRTGELLEELRGEYRTRGIQIHEVAGGFCFRSNADYAEYVRGHLSQRPVRLSRPQLETLAIIAYRQPITRPEVDDIRGVDSGPVLKGLLERDLVKILGKKDEPGRPMLYGTSAGFLALFNMQSLQDLPTLKEFTELSEESRRRFEHQLGEDAPDGPVDLSRLEAEVVPSSDPTEFDDKDDETGPTEGETADAGRDASTAGNDDATRADDDDLGPLPADANDGDDAADDEDDEELGEDGEGLDDEDADDDDDDDDLEDEDDEDDEDDKDDKASGT